MFGPSPIHPLRRLSEHLGTMDKTREQLSRIARATAEKIGLDRPLDDDGEIPAGSTILYAHLGGQPALSAYAGVL